MGTVVRRRGLLLRSVLARGESGMFSLGRAGRGGEVEPGLGSLQLSDWPELEPGLWEETSDTPSEPSESCLLSG